MFRRLLAPLALALGIAGILPCAPAHSADRRAPKVTTPKAALRLQPRRRLLPGQLRAVRRVPREARKGVGPPQGREHRRHRGEAAATHGDRHLAGQPQEAGTATRTSPAASPAPRASRPTKPTKLAAEGKAVVWIDGGLHASEMLCAQTMIETLYQLLSGDDAETLRILDDVIILFVHANPDGMDLVADWYMREKRSEEADARRPAAALSEVHRPRQQPRLLRQHAGRDAEHEPRHVPRVVAADRLQPPPVRPARHGAVLPAVPRPVQLQRRSARRQRHRRGRRGDDAAVPRRGQARRDHPLRRALLDVVERRPAHDLLLPQHDRPA